MFVFGHCLLEILYIVLINPSLIFQFIRIQQINIEMPTNEKYFQNISSTQSLKVSALDPGALYIQWINRYFLLFSMQISSVTLSKLSPTFNSLLCVYVCNDSFNKETQRIPAPYQHKWWRIFLCMCLSSVWTICKLLVNNY